MIFNHMDRIVFAGDSVTDMESAQPVGEGLFENVGKSYVRIVENMLAAFYPEVYLRVTNSGISGNTSRDLLQQFDSPAIPDEQVSPEEYRSNVEKMILSVKDNVKGIFLMTPYYMEPNGEDWMRKRMDTYGAICSELAEKYGCRFIDLQAVFNDYFQYRHSSYIAWDRIHPNQIGATVIARAFLEKCGFDYNHRPEHA